MAPDAPDTPGRRPRNGARREPARPREGTRGRRGQAYEGRTFGRLERVVTALVEAGLADRAAAPPNLAERLRNLELASGGDRQVLQVIASGRRLLGESDGPERPVASSTSAQAGGRPEPR
jgi:hypothetical protein